MRTDYVWTDGKREVNTLSLDQALALQKEAGAGKVWRRHFSDDGWLEGIELVSQAPKKKRLSKAEVIAAARAITTGPESEGTHIVPEVPPEPTHFCLVCGTPLDERWPYAACQPCGQRPCVHGFPLGACDACDAAGDQAYDVSKGN
jgi:hypothetical protein